jgi:hypothetical protein
MNPNPLAGLNHFTVPVATPLSLLKQWRQPRAVAQYTASKTRRREPAARDARYF